MKLNYSIRLFGILGLFAIFTGCSGGGGGGSAAVPTAYTINPVTQRIAFNTNAQHVDPAIATNNSGVQLAVWKVRRSESNGAILYSVYSGGVWGQENIVADADPYYSPAIASSGSDFMVAYERTGHYYVRRYNPVSGVWDAETQVDSGTQYYGQISIASNGTGYAVSWVQDDGAVVSLYANIYSAGVWSGATLIESGAGNVNVSLSSGPPIASNGSGYAVTWEQYDGTGYTGNRSIYTNIYAAAAWGGATILETTDGHASSPRIASNGSGYAVAWTQYDGISGNTGFLNVYANIYTGSWGGATLIETAAGNTLETQIAASGSGYAVTWSQFAASVYDIYANIYATGTWGSAIPLETGAGSARSPKIASNNSGYAVTWSQNDGSVNSIYASIYAGTWGVATLLENGPGAASIPVISGRLGSYAVVWSQLDGTALTIFASRYTGSWTAPANLVSRSYISDSIGQKVVSDSSGGRLLVWEQYNNGRNYIYGNLYASGVWGTPFVIGGSDTSDAYSPRIVSNGSGYAVVWYQYGTASYDLYSNIYSSGAWSGPTLIDSGTGSVSNYRVASNGSGYAVTWNQYDGSFSSIFANVYTAGTWGGVAPLEASTGNAYSTQIASNGSGYAVTWYQNDGSVNSIYANVFAGVAWGGAALLETASGAALSPLIASNGSGYAVTWYQNDGSVNSIYANVYASGAWGGAALLENASGIAISPLITSNGSGYAVAWTQNGIDANDRNVYANINSGSAWSGAVQVENSVNSVATALQLASNGSGYALAWYEDDATSLSMNASVYSGSAWGGKTLLETASGNVSAPQIASNGSGYAVVWYQNDGSVNSIYANAFNGIWGTATLLESGAGAVYAPQIVSSASGYCSVWPQKDPANGNNADAYQIWAASF